jgi:hypothetical protein
MNIKTTVVLLVLVVAGAVAWGLWGLWQPAPPPSKTLVLLQEELTPEKLTRVLIQRPGQPVELSKGADGEWSLPGHWPVRKPEVEQLIHLLTHLRSRFEPIYLANKEEAKAYGLDHPLRVEVVCGNQKYVLEFGEKPEEKDRFSRPTFFRCWSAEGEEKPSREVLRLAPGLRQMLDQAPEYYMQRQLFRVERVAASPESPSDKVEQVAAQQISFDGTHNHYTLQRTAEGVWEIAAPVHDRPEPEKLKKILTGIGDIWAEQFTERQKKPLSDFGLEKPEATLQVTQPDGRRITLLVGKVARTKTRLVKKSSPTPFGPPKPQMDIVHEEYRYAKLQENDQIFEIKSERIKDLDLPLSDLRDPQLARFRSDDVRRLEVLRDQQPTLVVVKAKDSWRLEKPRALPAEQSKVLDLIDKLAGLQARGTDILDKADLKKYGLDHPVVVRLELEEGKAKKSRTLIFHIGKHDAEQKKLYVQVTGWERVNAVEEGLEKLLAQPALTYRSRRLLDLKEADLARIDIERPEEKFALEPSKDQWQLAAPVRAELDRFKTEQLVRDLTQLEAAEFLTDQPKPEDVDKVYGLKTPRLRCRLLFKDAKKSPLELRLGNARAGKDETYAQLSDDPTIFTLRKDVAENLLRESLAYRPQEIWQLTSSEIEQIQVQKGNNTYTLQRQGENWQIRGPFEAPASPEQVRPLVEALSSLRAERWVAHTAKDLTPYGLEAPTLRLSVRLAAKEGKKAEERVLLLGKAGAVGDKKGRYARLANQEAIFLLADKTAQALDQAALDLLDRRLLALNPEEIQRLTAQGDHRYTLERQAGGWRVLDTPAPPFPADAEIVEDLLRACTLLRAQRYAAYGPKLELAPYGLDRPALLLTLTLRAPTKTGKEAAAPPDQKTKDKEKGLSPSSAAPRHTLALGKEVPDLPGARYARVDDGPAVAILDPLTVKDLMHNYLDFVNHTLLRLEPQQLRGWRREGTGGELEIVRQGADWQILKPVVQPADGPTLTSLAERLARLRAQQIAAYPAPAEVQSFGLDRPAAVLILRVQDAKGQEVEHRLELGRPLTAGKEDSARYARLDRGAVLFVLAGDLCRQLLAGPLFFRNREVLRLEPPTKLILDRGLRHAVFAEEEGTWRLTEPVTAEAENQELKDFVQHLCRLRAAELVAEKPADLAPYGLVRPQLRWQLWREQQLLASLLVGGRDKEGKRAYAKLEKSDLVFLLDETLTQQVFAEYRQRRVWPALDAVQIEKLRYQYPQSSFVLQKADKDWQVAGRPELVVKAEVLRDTLDALARLQADHYVLDQGGDRKLFGLEPPALLLEIGTATEQRTLLLGRQEGGTGGYYAVVGGQEKAPIFVIRAAEASKILRSLAELTSPAAKKEKGR